MSADGSQSFEQLYIYISLLNMFLSCSLGIFVEIFCFSFRVGLWKDMFPVYSYCLFCSVFIVNLHHVGSYTFLC